MDKKSVKFPEFNPQTDSWDNYIDRLKFCFEANGILVDAIKRANFFTICGAQVFETFLALITPRKASEVTFAEVEQILTKHYSPKPNEISTSFKFYKRNQKPGETASEYIAQLRKISSGCNFSELERMLRDRLVCGMSDQSLQYELLKKDNLRYQDVVDAMLSSESAGKDVRMIHNAASDRGECPTTSGTNTPATPAPEPMDINAVQSKANIRLCYRCGDRHGGQCRFINAVCRYCNKKGHLEKICIAKKKNSNRNVNFTGDDVGDANLLNGIYTTAYTGSDNRVPPYEVEVSLQGMPVPMQVDTGASFSLVNERTWRALRARLPAGALRPAPLALRTWTAAPVALLGQATVRVQHRDIARDLDLIGAKGSGPNLLGRDWLRPLDITLNINFISDADLHEVEKVTLKYEEVFKDGLGTYRGHPVAIHLKPDATPKFLKARPVPFAIKDRVETEIDRLVTEGVLRPTSFSDWATPVVPIVKKSGEIRLCGDYRSTVNQATESDTYPMPTANEVFATVAGGTYFTTLDLDRAYTQVVVDDETAKLLTLNTCKGLYTVHRLAFGVKACPGIFQRLMTSLLAGIPGVAVLIDDIIVSGRTAPEMLQRLDAVLQRVDRAGLRLNKHKCKFAKERVEFLGFVIDAEGIHPAPSKVDSIQQTPAPRNKQELQAFLGLYNFYERFIPHKATLLEPLHRLLDKTQSWQWTEREQTAFDTAKRMLTFDMTLVHYDLQKPLVITCDSSEYGVGAVLSHVMDDGQERPIAMSSRTLHTHERRYSQLDKEATAIMFAVQKFHNYISGRSFTIVTDHKPLLGIFDPKRPMPNMLSPRLMRIALALTAHSYDITYRPGSQIGNADALSRWPQPVPDQPEQQLGEILLMAETPEDFSCDIEQIVAETRKDKTLSQVIHHLQRGWPARVTDEELRAYWLRRGELSLQAGCVLLGNRVVLPAPLRRPALRALHNTHSGIVHTKALARSYIWWPHLDDDIETLVNGCTKCLENRHMPPRTSHEWITPTRPWARIHIDFAGPFQNKFFLIVVDSYSRWPEVVVVNNMTAATVIRHLRMLFATHGLCETLVSDNGTSFVATEMKQFLNANKIRHITTAPYHPATNGLAERMVQTVKDKLRKMDTVPWDIKIPNLLLALRVTPCSATNKSPAELLMNRRLRTLLDTIHPENLQHKKTEHQIEANAQRKHRETNVGQKVMYRNYSNGPRWLPGKVVDKNGPSSYKVQTNDGLFVNRHIDQLLKLAGSELQEGASEVRGSTGNENVEVDNGHDDGDEPTEGLCQDPDNIIEIPSSERWAEMLGIPSHSDGSQSLGKIRNKLNAHTKSPYERS